MSHLLATRRHLRQRGLGLGHKSPHNLAYRQNFLDAACGLTRPEHTLMLTARLCSRDNLAAQSITLATRLFALASPFVQESRWQRSWNRRETLCPWNWANVIENINFNRVLGIRADFGWVELGFPGRVG